MYMYIYINIHICLKIQCDKIWGFYVTIWYGVATISRLLNISGLFCKRAL